MKTLVHLNVLSYDFLRKAISTSVELCICLMKVSVWNENWYYWVA